nr:umbelliferone-6-dimethyl-allyl-transferase [Ficus carica]
MALVQRFGKPDIFLTITRNPNWLEIKQELGNNDEACAQAKPADSKPVYTKADTELASSDDSLFARASRFGAACYTCLYARVLNENQLILQWPLWLKAFPGLIAIFFVNAYANGINQVFDIDIDRVNKPYLPLVSGELSLKHVWLMMSFCVISGLLIFWLCNADLISTALYCFGLFLATSYSAPPFRFKGSTLATTMLLPTLMHEQMRKWQEDLLMWMDHRILNRLSEFLSGRGTYASLGYGQITGGDPYPNSNEQLQRRSMICAEKLQHIHQVVTIYSRDAGCGVGGFRRRGKAAGGRGCVDLARRGGGGGGVLMAEVGGGGCGVLSGSGRRARARGLDIAGGLGRADLPPPAGGCRRVWAGGIWTVLDPGGGGGGGGGWSPGRRGRGVLELGGGGGGGMGGGGAWEKAIPVGERSRVRANRCQCK